MDSDQEYSKRDFPSGPVVDTLHFHYRGYGFEPWSGNFRSHMLHGVIEKGKRKKQTNKKNAIRYPIQKGNNPKMSDTRILVIHEIE